MTNPLVTTAPATDPISLGEAKAHLRVTHDSEDTLIATYLKAALQHSEDFTGRQFVTAQYTYYLDRFVSKVRIPRPPLQSVEAIRYFDTDGVQQTLATSEYTVVITEEPGFVTPAWEKVWPSIRPLPSGIEIDFTAGYGAAAAVPERAKAGVMHMLAHYYEHRTPIEILAGETVQKVGGLGEDLLYDFQIREVG